LKARAGIAAFTSSKNNKTSRLVTGTGTGTNAWRAWHFDSAIDLLTIFNSFQ
jgi:hypothetical protein